MGYTPANMSYWTLSCITIERFIAVRFPLRAASWCTRKRAKITIVCITIESIIVIGVPNLFRVYRFLERGTMLEICNFDPALFPAWVSSAYYLMVGIHGVWVPFFLIAIFNVLIVMTLTLRKSTMLNKSMDEAHQSSKKAMERQITKLLLMVTTVFLVLTFPYTFFEFFPVIKDPLWKKVAYEISVFFSYVNVSINFYLYCMGYKKFRREFVNIFCLRKLNVKSKS